MPDILVYAETVDGNPIPASVGLVTGARSLAGGGKVIGFAVVDGDRFNTDPLVGADLIVTTKSGVDSYIGERHIAGLLEAIAKFGPGLVLIANTYIGLDLAAGVAARTGRPILSYCQSLELDGGTLRACCQAYGGKIEANLECLLPAVAAVNPGAFEPTEASGTAETSEMPQPEIEPSVSVICSFASMQGDIDITAVDRLVSVGRGIGDEGNLEMVRELADLLGAELVASRPVVDLGWVEKSRQVGKSGKIVKPKLYLALGISGAPEHLEGMQDSELIIAVNTDGEAPIFDVAHYGIRCDALELLPVLTEKLQRRSS